MRIEAALLPKTSVEKALNSRCSSSNDEDQSKGHWGIYDSETPLPEQWVKEVQKATHILRFTAHKTLVEFSERPIVVMMQPGVEGMEGEWLHVESGMQQQAVHVACAGLGLGTCIYNVGRNGSPRGDWHATAEMGLAMMKPSYGGERWTSEAPEGLLSGGGDLPLPEPNLEGTRPFVEVVESLAVSAAGNESTVADWSRATGRVRLVSVALGCQGADATSLQGAPVGAHHPHLGGRPGLCQRVVHLLRGDIPLR